jgi:hypothetical protein
MAKYRVCINQSYVILTYITCNFTSVIYYNVLYSSADIVRLVKSRRRREAHVARMREKKGVYRVLVGKPGGKRPLGRPRRRWEEKIKIDLQEIRGGVYGLDQAGPG